MKLSVKLSIKLDDENIKLSEWYFDKPSHFYTRYVFISPKNIYKSHYNFIEISLEAPWNRDKDLSKYSWDVSFYGTLSKLNNIYRSIYDDDFKYAQIKTLQNQVDNFLKNYNLYQSFL